MKIGIESAAITPQQPIELIGYGYFPDRTSQDIDSPLIATALTFEDTNGKRAALCGVDIHSVDAGTVSKVSEAVSTIQGELTDTTILINASHTHSGPSGHAGLVGIGKHSDEYIDTVLVPNLANAIVTSFSNADDGEIGIGRTTAVDDLSYNRTGGESLDTRITTVRADTEKLQAAAAHFACHPVVYGSKSKIVSSDYPGVARDTLKRHTRTDRELWLTGSAGDIDPSVNKEHKGVTSRVDVEALGVAVGEYATELYPTIQLGSGALRLSQINVNLPVNTAFELDPIYEAQLYREARKLPKSQDLGPLNHWLETVAPIINGKADEAIAVPVTLIAIGKLVFAGIGAEIYNETGMALESAHPDLDIITMMTSNEHQGYIPPSREYDTNAYAARTSSFFFSRKPLLPSSEAILQSKVNEAIEKLFAQY